MIGAGKSGTTTLANHLRGHPQVFMTSVKEPNFFTFHGGDPNHEGPGDYGVRRNAIKDIEGYSRLFAARKDELVAGEASTTYLISEQVPGRIHELFPRVKIVCILRHPVEAAWSGYRQRRRRRFEQESFLHAWRADDARRRARWTGAAYKSKTRYHEHLQRYYATFDAERICVLLFEDLASDPDHLLRELSLFLGIGPLNTQAGDRRDNEAGESANAILRLLWDRQVTLRSHISPFVPVALRGRVSRLIAKRTVKKSIEPLSAQIRAELTAECREDILRLQDLIGRDLSSWLEPSGAAAGAR